MALVASFSSLIKEPKVEKHNQRNPSVFEKQMATCGMRRINTKAEMLEALNFFTDGRVDILSLEGISKRNTKTVTHYITDVKGWDWKKHLDNKQVKAFVFYLTGEMKIHVHRYKGHFVVS